MLNRVIDDLERALASDAEILDREGITHWLIQFSAGLPLELEHPRMGKISYRGLKFSGSVVPTFDRYVALQVDDLVERHVRKIEAEMATVSSDQLDAIARDAAAAIERTRARLLSRAGQVKATLLKGSSQRTEALIDRSGVRPMNPSARFAARAVELKIMAPIGAGSRTTLPQNDSEGPRVENVVPGVAARREANEVGTRVEVRAVATLTAVVVPALWNTGAARGRVIELIEATEKNLELLRSVAAELDRHCRGHNNPPELVEELPLDSQDLQVALAAIPVLRHLVEQREPDRDIIILTQRAFDSARRSVDRFLSWVARLGSDAAKAAATAYGKIMGGAVAIGTLVEVAKILGLNLQTIKEMTEAVLKLLGS